MTQKTTVNAAALTEAEAARYLNVSRSYLRQARMKKRPPGTTDGPRYVHAGRMIRYPVRFLDEWMDKHAVDPNVTTKKESRK